MLSGTLEQAQKLYLYIMQHFFSSSQEFHTQLTALYDLVNRGSGFYGYAQDLGMLPRNASAMQKLEFWAGQVKALHEYYAAGRR